MADNLLTLSAQLSEIQPLRKTPAGIAVIHCQLAHVSSQTEAEIVREVRLELQAIAIGELAQIIAVATPGCQIHASGFLAAKSHRSHTPVFHLNHIEFIEGNEHGPKNKIQEK